MKPENQIIEYMQWNPELDTGIQVIDNQHKRIVDYINKLDDANRTGDPELTETALAGLVDYTSTHFAFEEELLEKSGYPFLKAHQKVHRMFMKRVNNSVERARHGENVAPELLNMLRVWLISHIKGDDRDYVEAVKKISARDEKYDSWVDSTLKKLFG